MFKIRKSERGQALAEYMPLFPPVLLLAITIVIPIGERTSDLYCEIVNRFDPSKCEVIEEEFVPVEEDLECTVLQEEMGGSQCDLSDDCNLLPGLNTGVYWASAPVESFVIKAAVEYHVFDDGFTSDGCYFVTFDDDNFRVDWDKVGTGSDCKDVSHAQAWKVPVCTP